jgi:iron(III) transport system substrate-binding protein
MDAIINRYLFSFAFPILTPRLFDKLTLLGIRVCLKIVVLFMTFALVSCSDSNSEVVVYTSVDQIFSEVIIKQFEQDTGIKVKAVYDTEAVKTVGLEKRLIAEKENPKADIFWNSEHLRTLRLKALDLLAPYKGMGYEEIPGNFKDPDGLWVGFGARYRVFVVNNGMINKENIPLSLEALTNKQWEGKAAIAKPYFGTTSTHFAALYTRYKEERYRKLLHGIKSNKVALLSGNSHVRDAVVRGEYAFGLTDTDDVSVAVDRGENVSMVFADHFGDGAYAIPHTVSMISGGPNPENGKKFIDYLLSKAVIQKLVDAGAVHGPIRKNLGIKTKHLQPERIWLESSSLILEAMEPSADLARKIFNK